MAGISVTGVGSGLDINQIVTDLISAERKAADTRLETKKTIAEAKLSAIGSIKSAVSDFQTALSGIKTASNFKAMSATVSDETFTATATTAAQAGDYSIQVNTLAQAHKLISANNNASGYQDTTTVIGTGTLTFEFGTYDATTGAGYSALTGTNTADGATFTSASSKNVTITSSNNTLAGIRDAINSAGVGVRAGIMYDGNEYRLTLSSSSAGVNNAMRISVSDADGNNTNTSGLSVLAYDPTAGTPVTNMTRTTQALDAEVEIDGTVITSSSNTISTAIPGVTLNLKSVGTTTATLSVTQDTEAASEAVSTFVEAYNTMVSTIKPLTAYDSSKKDNNGVLLGDVTINSMVRRVNNMLMNSVSGITGSYKSLSSVGVSFQKDGTLALDSTKLQTALTQDVSAVTSLFTRSGKTTDSLISYNSLRTSSTSETGTYDVRVARLATQGQFVGAALAAAPVTINGTNNTFQVMVNGVGSGTGSGVTVTLAQQSYAYADLITEIQTQINADSTLKNAGASVTVSESGGKLTFTSNAYGSSSSVKFTSTNSTLGISASITTATTGQNATGWITEAVASQGQYEGVAGSGAYVGSVPGTGAFNITAANGNNTIGIKVNGTSATVTLDDNAAYTGTTLAAELQGKINGNTTLSTAGVVVSVGYDSTTGKFTFTSNKYGSSSSVSFTADNTTIGVSSTSGTSTVGRDGTRESLATQGYYTGQALGAGAGAFTVASPNNTLSLQIDGTTSGTISLSAGIGYTGAALASHLQSQINADATLLSAGKSVRVDYDSTAGQFSIVSNSYGADSTVDLYTVDATLAATLGLTGVSKTYVGNAMGAGVGAFNIMTGGDTFKIDVDGVSSGTITLSDAGNPYTGAVLAAHIETQINADTLLSAAGRTVTVAYNSTNGRFEITSDEAGSTASVAINTVTSTLSAVTGLVVASGTDGKDGLDGATGSGRVLTGTGDANGIAVDILGGSASSSGYYRGTVSLSDGIGQQLDTFLEELLSDSGGLGGRIAGLNDQLESITEQTEALDDRMTALEARYRAQFTAMDALVAQLTATSNFLTQFFDTKSDDK